MNFTETKPIFDFIKPIEKYAPKTIYCLTLLLFIIISSLKIILPDLVLICFILSGIFLFLNSLFELLKVVIENKNKENELKKLKINQLKDCKIFIAMFNDHENDLDKIKQIFENQEKGFCVSIQSPFSDYDLNDDERSEVEDWELFLRKPHTKKFIEVSYFKTNNSNRFNILIREPYFSILKQNIKLLDNTRKL